MNDFNTLLESARAIDAQFSDVDIDLSRLSVTENGIVAGDKTYSTPPDTWERLFAAVAAPVNYVRKHPSTLQAALLTQHIENGDFGSSVRAALNHNTLYTFFRSDLIHLSNSDVLRAVATGLGENTTSLYLPKIEADGDRVEVELLSPRKTIEVRRGDLVQGGMQIVHHRFGEHATTIQSYMLRQVCSNGMTIRECVSRDGIVRTRKLPTGHPNGRELQLAQIAKLAGRTWQALEPQLEELKSSSQQIVDVRAVLTRWLERARMSQRLLPRLLDAWQVEGSENTQFGVVNAITRVATHDHALSLRQRRMLTSLGGLLAYSRRHICPRCFTVLGGSGSDRQDEGAETLH